jgi:virginiamycin B lyase
MRTRTTRQRVAPVKAHDREREVTLAKTPSNNTYPCGTQVNSKGIPWYVDFRGNRIGSVDPVTRAIKEYTLPDPAARPRRIALTPDDVVWYADYARPVARSFDQCTSPLETGACRQWVIVYIMTSTPTV